MDRVASSLANRIAVVMLGLMLPAVTPATHVGAQTPGTDTTTRRLRVDMSRLRGSVLAYQTTIERDASTTILGTRTLSVATTMYVGSPSWLILETRTGDGISAADSLFLGFSDFRPVHWSSPLGDARLSMEFRGDTAFGAMSVPGGRRSIVASIPAGSLINAAMLETVLRLLPLQTAWEDSGTVLTVSANANSVLPARLSVIGEDRVRVPAGTFDCWVVAVRADQARGLYWVTKQDPIVVRSTLDIPSLGGAQLVSALTRIGR